MSIVLETERLVLRRFTSGDLDDLVDLDGDPAVMRFLTGGRPTPHEVVRDELLPGILRDYDRFPGWGRWAALDRASGCFLGWFELRPREPGIGAAGSRDVTEVELGYRLRRATWGRGYATEGSRALVGMGFSAPGVRRVFAETMAVNTASRRVMEKVGLRLVRTFHLTWEEPIAGAEHGEVEYELLRTDWDGSAGSCEPAGRWRSVRSSG